MGVGGTSVMSGNSERRADVVDRKRLIRGDAVSLRFQLDSDF